MKCEEKLSGCTCSQEVGHSPPCTCPCGGSWEYIGTDLIVHAFPVEIVDGPLAGICTGPELMGVLAWCGLTGVIIPHEDGMRGYMYGSRDGRVLRMDTGEITASLLPPQLWALSLFGGMFNDDDPEYG